MSKVIGGGVVDGAKYKAVGSAVTCSILLCKKSNRSNAVRSLYKTIHKMINSRNEKLAVAINIIPGIDKKKLSGRNISPVTTGSARDEKIC